MNRLVISFVNRLVNTLVKQLVNRWVNRWVIQSVIQLSALFVNRLTNQWFNRSVDQWVNKLVNIIIQWSKNIHVQNYDVIDSLITIKTEINGQIERNVNKKKQTEYHNIIIYCIHM